MTGSGTTIETGGKQVCHVIQGEYRVSGDPDMILTTILGSCVSMCLCDPTARVGGMNHFLLPEGKRRGEMGFRYGLLAMELLINGLLKLGARRDRMEAKLFGGAIMNDRLSRIGDANSAFALRFLAEEGIRCTSQSLGGTQARRIRYVPFTGHAQQRLLRDHLAYDTPCVRPVEAATDDVTLF